MQELTAKQEDYLLEEARENNCAACGEGKDPKKICAYCSGAYKNED